MNIHYVLDTQITCIKKLHPHKDTIPTSRAFVLNICNPMKTYTASEKSKNDLLLYSFHTHPTVDTTPVSLSIRKSHCVSLLSEYVTFAFSP